MGVIAYITSVFLAELVYVLVNELAQFHVSNVLANFVTGS